MAPDSGGGFASLGHFVRTAVEVQDKRGRYLEAADRDLWRTWMAAHCVHRNLLADRDRRQLGEVQRAVTSPDGMFELSDPDGAAPSPHGFVTHPAAPGHPVPCLGPCGLRRRNPHQSS